MSTARKEMLTLTERQKREKKYYEEFSQRNKREEISFEPVLGKERRPWNPYWYVYEHVLQSFRYEGQKMLDFGCGSGISSIRFAKIGYEVWGFDVSEAQINIAEENATRYGLEKKTHFSLQVTEHLDYPSEFFDLIVGFDILHHVEIRQSISECRRVLKKDGIAIFKEPVEAPVFDKIRNTWLGLALVPQRKSFDRHITEDERKLTSHDIAITGEIFPGRSNKRFTCLSRLDEFIRNRGSRKPSFLEKVDYFMFRTFPFLMRYGGNVVLIMKK